MSSPLSGPRAKIDRANEHVNTLRDELARYFTVSDPHVLKAVAHPDRGSVEVGLHAPDVPLRFGIIIGEVVHQLRSSLDHLVWQLVVANGRTPGLKHQFPICDSPREFERQSATQLNGVAREAIATIETYQPYRSGKPEQSSLWSIREIDNHDKHRSVLETAATAVYTTRFFEILFADGPTPPPHVIDPKRHVETPGYPVLSIILKHHGGTQAIVPYLQFLSRRAVDVIEGVGLLHLPEPRA